MADGQENIDVKIKFQVEGESSATGAYAKLQNQIETTRKNQALLNKAIDEMDKDNQARELGKYYGELATQLNDSNLAAKQLAKSLTEIGATGPQIRAAASEFQRMKDTQNEAGGSDSGGGRVNFGAIGRAASGLGLGDVGGIANTVDDVKDLFEQIKVGGEAIPAVASAAEALTPALGATAAGFVAVAAPIALVAAAAIPLALAIKSVSDEVDRNVKAYKDELEALRQATDFKNQNITEARTRTAEQNRQEAEDQSQRIKNQEDYLNQLRKQRADIDKEYSELGSSLNPAKRKELAGKGSEVDTQIEAATQELIKLGAEFENTVTVLGPVIDANEKKKKAEEDAAKATNINAQIIQNRAAVELKVQNELKTFTLEAAQARLSAIDDEKKSIQNQIDQLSALPNRTGEVTDKLKSLGTQMDALNQEAQGLSAGLNNLPAEIKKASDELAKLNTQITDVESKRKTQLANREQEDKRAGEIADLENQIKKAQNDEVEQLNRDKITKLKAEGGDAEAQAIVKQNDRIQQINDQFFANQTKAWNSYYTAETRADAQHKTDRLRQLEDLNASLLNLSASRDVAGFIQARTSGLTNIRRGDEDASTASRQRREDYETQAREADEARNKQLADLRTANERENTERRNALNKRIAEEEAAGQGQLKQSEILQQKLATLRQQYASEDLAARRRNEDEAYNTQIGKLRQRQSELNNIVGKSLDPARTSLVNLANGIVNFINQIRTAASAPAPRPPTISGYSNGSYTPPPASAAKQATVVVQNLNMGKVATPADVAAAQRNIIQAVHTATGGY